MYTIDASVHINALNSTEDGSAASQACLQQLVQRHQPIISPILLVVEVAAATARALSDTELAVEMAEALQGLPGQVWVPLDDELAVAAARLAAAARLRGADAVYGAVAQRYGTTLVTRDQQQLERLGPLMPVTTPEAVVTALTDTP